MAVDPDDFHGRVVKEPDVSGNTVDKDVFLNNFVFYSVFRRTRWLNNQKKKKETNAVGHAFAITSLSQKLLQYLQYCCSITEETRYN